MVGMMNKGSVMPASRQRSKVPTLVQAVEAVTWQGLRWGALLAAAALDARESLLKKSLEIKDIMMMEGTRGCKQ
ncbi:hypothetical protein V6N13_047276 [Hibiscus sabdariffa]